MKIGSNREGTREPLIKKNKFVDESWKNIPLSETGHKQCQWLFHIKEMY